MNEILIQKRIKLISFISPLLGIIGSCTFYLARDVESVLLLFYYLLFGGLISILCLIVVLFSSSYKRKTIKGLLTTIAFLVINYSLLVIIFLFIDKYAT
jgi:hypothetical protein